MKRFFILMLSLLLIFILLFGLSACNIFDDKEANCSAGKVTLKYNYLNDYYFLEATIKNTGDADAKYVRVYYYWGDLYSMKDYSDYEIIGTIKAGSSVTFQSRKIYASQYGSEIVKYGISDVKWS